MRLYLDPDVDVNLTVRLGGYGYDVVTTLAVRNLGNPDEKQLEYAANNDRAILTPFVVAQFIARCSITAMNCLTTNQNVKFIRQNYHNRRDFRRLHRDWIHRALHHCGVIVSVHINLGERVCCPIAFVGLD